MLNTGQASVLLGGITLLVGLAGMTSAHAQQTAPSTEPASMDSLSLDEVIVTARRKEENLQTVPVSVTALSGDALTAKGVSNLTNLQNQVPSLRVQASDINPKAFLVGMRGLKSGTYAATEDPVVGTYFAEVIQAHPYGFGATMFDLQSVQVLKGPQGTLFGRNHTAGAILVEPNKASIADGFDGSIKVSGGNYDAREVQAVLNAPLNDISAVRLAYRGFKRDGYTKNVLTGQRFDNSDEQVGRGSFLLAPTENFSSHTILDYLLDKGGPTSSQNTEVFTPQISAGNLAVYGPNVAAQSELGARRIASVYGTGIGGFGNTTAPGNDMMAPAQCEQFPGNRVCRDHLEPQQEIESKGVVNNTSWDLGSFTIKNIVGYRKVSHLLEASSVVAPVPIASAAGVGFQGIQDNRQSQLSEELQFSGKAFDDRLDWIAGGFFFREIWDEYAPSFGFSTTTYNISQSHGDNRAKAVFGQGSYQLSDQFKLTLGLRRNFDKRRAVNNSRNGFSVATGLPAACQFRNADNTPLTGTCELEGEKEWNATTWNASLEYQLNPDTMFYAASRKGYKSGGFARNANIISRFTFDPEFVQDYELGAKADVHLGDMPLRINAAIYRSDISDMQLNISEVLAGSNPPIFFSFTNNAGKARVEGAEMELTFRPLSNLDLTGFVGYTKPKYIEYINPAGGPGGTPVDLSDVPFGINYAVPKWQGGLTTTYTIPLQDKGDLRLIADVTARSRAPIDNEKWFALKGTAFNPQMPDPGRTLLNLRADWDHVWGSPVTASLFCNNCTDKLYKDGGTQVIGIFSTHWAPPRMYGLELTYAFGEGFKPR